MRTEAMRRRQLSLFGKKRDNTGAATNLFVEIFQHVGGAQSLADFFGKLKDGEAFRESCFHPGREFGSGFFVFGDGLFEELFGLFMTRGVEDVTDIRGDFFTHRDFGDVGLSILLKVELAALPWAGRKDGAKGSSQAFVSITGDGFWKFETALLEASKKVMPVDFGLGE